jgi:predicted RNase H-like nuclease (RuvC/YqgF family)
MIKIDETHPCCIARHEGETKLTELRMRLRKEQGELDSKLPRYLAQKSAERSNDSEVDQLLSGSASTDRVSAQEIEDLNHRIAVLERAIEKQLDTVSNLRTNPNPTKS